MVLGFDSGLWPLRVVVAAPPQVYMGRFAADPFRLAALATHPLDRDGQGTLRTSLPAPQPVILKEVKNLGTWTIVTHLPINISRRQWLRGF